MTRSLKILLMDYFSDKYLKERKIHINPRGYLYFCDVKHPINICGKISLHRHLASVYRGKWLLSGEVVHHRDGNKHNNSPENLVVFPSQSEHLKLENKNWGNKYSKNARKFDPSIEELEKLVWKYPTVWVANMFGVSDKAVEKRCKLFGIKKPPRGYWEKKYHSKE